MVYLLFKKSEGVPEKPVESPNSAAPESSPSLGHRVTLFTTNHTENGTASADPTRIVLPVSLGHPAGTGTAARKWQQRRAVNIAFDLPDLGGSASGAKIPPGPIRDFWAASTPTAEHLAIARDQQRMGGLVSRSGRKRMERNIGSYITPENVHEKLSGAVDAVKDENSAIQRVGMACYEDLSNEHNFCHRRIIAKGLSDKLGVPIPDIFHISQLQQETNNTDQPLKYFEDTILHPMRAIAERKGLDLSKDKDELQGIFQAEIPALARLNQITAHWDSQKEEPLIQASATTTSAASPGVVSPTMTASVPAVRQVFGPQSEVSTAEDAINHPSVKNSAFQQELLEGNWNALFDQYVSNNYYSAFVRDLQKQGKTPEQVAAICLEIRKNKLNEFMKKNSLLNGASIANDGSTVVFPNSHFFDALREKEPSLLRIMIGNHGVYAEHGQPVSFTSQDLQRGSAKRQYNAYFKDGIKYYQQTVPVNYAEYKPGNWYSSAEKYLNLLPQGLATQNENQGQISVGLPDTKDPLDETGIHTYPHSNITRQAWKPIFSNLVDSPIPFRDRVTKEQLIAKSSETLYQAGKFKKNDNGSLSEICKKVLSGRIKGLPGTETLPQNPSSLQVKQFVANYLRENPEQADPDFYDKRISIMKNILMLKAKTNKTFADTLYESGTDPLVESTWGRADTFWGATNAGRPDGTQQGRNILGKLLMQIRDELFPLKSSVDPEQQSQQVVIPSGTQLDLLKTTMAAKTEPYNRLFSKAIISEDGSTVDISRLDRNFLENREPGFSRLISTPQGMFVEIHKVEEKTKVSDKGQTSSTSVMHERETPPSTRSANIFLQTATQNGFMKGKWYAPLEDYLPR